MTISDRLYSIRNTKEKTMEKTLSSHIITMGYENYKALWLDYTANFQSIEAFAKHHKLEFCLAVSLINNAEYLYGGGDHEKK